MSVSNAKELLAHVGHEIVVVTYGMDEHVVNVAIECETCNEVLISFDMEDVEEDDG